MDGKIFRCYGDLVFKDGDSVKFYAYKTDKGYYRVKYIENFTRNFTATNFYLDNPPKDMFEAVTKGIFVYGKRNVIILTIVAGLIWIFVPSSFVIAWIISAILCACICVFMSINECKKYIADFEINNKAD